MTMIRLIAYLALASLLPIPAVAQVIGVSPSIYAGAPALPTLPLTSTPIPSLPLANGAKIIAFGDSHAGFNGSYTDGATPQIRSTEKGLIEGAWQIDPRFTFDQFYDPGLAWGSVSDVGPWGGANQGFPGDHMTVDGVRPGIVQRLAYTLSRQPAILWVSAGTNSIATGDDGSGRGSSAEYIQQQLDYIVTQATARGVWVILPTYYPRDDSFFSASKSLVAQSVNEWIRAQTGRPGVMVYDPYDALLAPGSTYQPNPAYFLDKVHLNAAGVSMLARNYLVPLLQTMIASGSTFDQNAATSNIYASSIYGMTGTTGTKVGAQTTGSVATGYSLRMLRIGAGATQVASKDTSNGTFNKQVITITNPATPGANWDQSQLTFSDQAISTATVPAGSWVRAYILVETDADQPTPSISWQLTVKNSGGSQRLNVFAGWIDSNQYNSAVAQPVGRGAYWLRTPVFQMPADGDYSAIGAVLSLSWRENFVPASQVMTVKVSKPIIRLSSDPRPALNLP
jgi:lysophospholipase L1-like esterase